jgi:hypothetical protein
MCHFQLPEISNRFAQTKEAYFIHKKKALKMYYRNKDLERGGRRGRG